MSWRYKWSLLHTAQKSQIFKTRSIRHISSSPTLRLNLTHKNRDLSPEEIRNFILTPQVVHSTLLNCPSDLIALSFFIWCGKRHNYFHNNQAFDHMVCVVTRLANRYRTLEAIVRELYCVGVATKPQIFLLLLRIFWRGGMYSMVFEAFEQMDSLGFTPNTFARNVLMDVSFKIRRPDIGIKILKENMSPNFLSFNIALCNLCKLIDLLNAMDVLRLMLRKGYYPNVKTFEMVLSCFCKVGRLKGAYQVLGLMISLGISLSVNAWSILIDGLCRLHQPVMAANLLELMIKCGCSPNVVTYTTLFKGFMESRMVTSAFGILNAMESKGCAADLVLCNVLIDSFCKIGKHDHAVDLFLGLPKWNLVPDSYTFCSLLSTICFSRRFNLLPKLVSGLFIEADVVVYNSLLNYFCKAGLPFLAVELYETMIEKGFIPDNYTFAGLLRALCGISRTDEAVNVYHGLVMTSSGLDAHVHTAIVDGLIRSGQYNRAIRLFRRSIAERHPVDAVSYTTAIRGLLRGGRTVEAYTLYDQMKEFGLSPNAHTYSVMLCGFCRKRDDKMVKMLMEEIVEGGVQLDYNTLVRLTSFFLKSHIYSSSIDQLIELWNLGSISYDSAHALLFDGLAYGVKVGDKKHFLSRMYLRNSVYVDSSSSDDLSDMAASVG